MKRDRLIKIVNNFFGKKIAVIGDIIMDEFVFGSTLKNRKENRAPVILEGKKDIYLGGAANVANNITTLGGKVFLFGIIGEDAAGEKMIGLLEKNKINMDGILHSEDRPTTKKIRIVADNIQIARLDQEDADPINIKSENNIINLIKPIFAELDAIVVSDYGKGLITKNIALEIVKLAKKNNKFIIGDIKPSTHAEYFKGITLLTPNAKEAMEISGVKDIKNAGKIISKKNYCSVLIKNAEKGMTLFSENKINHFPAIKKVVSDTIGAGDTVAAVISLALASKSDLEEAAEISNYAAGIVVSKKGTSVVTKRELMNSLN
jgi:rfaE bifunctional protein kinase chain/domain